VSYRQDEAKQEPSQLSMFLHGWECVMQELRGTPERMQELEKLHAHFQNELISLKMTVKGQDKMLIHSLSELESLKMTVKAKYEILIQLLSDSARIFEVDDEHDAHSHNEFGSASIMQEDNEGPAHFQNVVESVRDGKMRAEE
jgi:archaellum component FlaC